MVASYCIEGNSLSETEDPLPGLEVGIEPLGGMNHYLLEGRSMVKSVVFRFL